MIRGKILRVILVASFFIGVAQSVALAEDAVTTTTGSSVDSQELQNLKAEAELAKTKLDLETSEINLLKLKLGTLDTTNLPKGAADVTDLDVEGQLRAYAAAARIADQIVADITTAGSEALAALGDAKNLKLVLATQSQLQLLNQYRSALAQMALIKDAADAVLKQADPSPNMGTCAIKPEKEKTAPEKERTAGFVPADGVAAINAVLSLTALFKTDLTIKEKPVSLSEVAVATLLLKALKAKQITAIYPPAYYMLPPVGKEGKTIEAYKALMAQKRDLQDYADKLNKLYEATSGNTKADPECKVRLAGYKTIIDQRVAGLQAAQKSVDDIVATLTKQDGQSGLTTISTYLVSERIDADTRVAVKGPDGKIKKDTDGKDMFVYFPVLQVQAMAAGGSTSKRQNIFRTAVSLGGGALISYQLMAQSGEVLAADAIGWNAGYIDMKKISAGRILIDAPTR